MWQKEKVEKRIEQTVFETPASSRQIRKTQLSFASNRCWVLKSSGAHYHRALLATGCRRNSLLNNDQWIMGLSACMWGFLVGAAASLQRAK